MTEERSEDLFAEVERLIDTLSAHSDPAVRETTSALLANIDVVHRTALTHLMGAIRSMGGDAFVNRLVSDPAIRLLLMSYDLLAVDRRTLTEEALDTVRGHLHSHGIDVELVEVLGGVITVRLHGVSPEDPTHAAALKDIHDALSAELIGFHELQIDAGDRKKNESSIFLPADALRRAKRPTYRQACTIDDIPLGGTHSVMIDDLNVLLARIDGDIYAVRNTCGDSPLPLDYSSLNGTELTCSWHGCRYDVRTGQRLDFPDASREQQLTILPVRVHDGMIEIAVGTTAATSAESAA